MLLLQHVRSSILYESISALCSTGKFNNATDNTTLSITIVILIVLKSGKVSFYFLFPYYVLDFLKPLFLNVPFRLSLHSFSKLTNEEQYMLIVNVLNLFWEN